MIDNEIVWLIYCAQLCSDSLLCMTGLQNVLVSLWSEQNYDVKYSSSFYAC